MQGLWALFFTSYTFTAVKELFLTSDMIHLDAAKVFVFSSNETIIIDLFSRGTFRLSWGNSNILRPIYLPKEAASRPFLCKVRNLEAHLRNTRTKWLQPQFLSFSLSKITAVENSRNLNWNFKSERNLKFYLDNWI